MQNDDYIPSKDEDRPTVFSTEIPENEWEMPVFQAMMDKLHDEHENYVGRLALELNVSAQCACDIAYLRSRSRWTEELEHELIELHKNETPPNIFEFGN